MKDKIRDENIDYLFRAILTLENADDCYNFFTDLCTPGEITAMAQRLAAAKLLLDGCTYEQVISLTDISSATLSRVSKCVKRGEGYRNILGGGKTTEKR